MRYKDRARDQVLGVGRGVVANGVQVVVVLMVMQVVLVLIVHLMVSHDAHVGTPVKAAETTSRTDEVWDSWAPALVAVRPLRAMVLGLSLWTSSVLLGGEWNRWSCLWRMARMGHWRIGLGHRLMFQG